MGGTEGQIYIPLGRKEEGKVDMVQQKSHGSHGKRAKLAIGLICGVALLAGMALLTHKIGTGDTKHLVTESLKSEDKSDLARSMDSWILERLATEVEGLKEEVARKNNQTAEMSTGVEGLKEEVSELKELFCFHGGSSYDPRDDIAGEGRSTEVSAAACQERCAGVPGCNFFSFWHNGGCHLSSSAATIKTGRGVTAGPKHCPRMATAVKALKEEVVKLKASTCTVEENMDYWGSDIAGQIRLPADDKDMCILLCAEEVRCSYWTYHAGMCWLKTSDSGRKSHPTAISGSRGCVEMATGVKGLKDEVSQLKALFCPSPWTLLSTGCYLFDTTPRKWTEADQFCKGRFSKLIEVETTEENEALVEEFIRKDWNSLKLEPWLGLTDLKDEGTFLWSSSGQEANYTNWKPGQPNNAGVNAHCVHYDSTNTWSDRQCDNKAYGGYGWVAVCEKI